MSKLKVIAAPMAGGKTTRLLSEYRELSYRQFIVAAHKPWVEKRDSGIESRSGERIYAKRVKRLGDIALPKKPTPLKTAIMIDEAFMFNEDIDDTVATIENALSLDNEVRIATLDYSAMGEEMRVFSALKQLGPEIIYCSDAVCDFSEICGNEQATRTLIYNGNTKRPIRAGLPEVVPEDPKNPVLGYSPVCIDCFEGTTSERALVRYLQTRAAA